MIRIPGFTGAMIAGGQGRRMGADKAAFVFLESTLGARVVSVLEALFDDVLVVERADNRRAWPESVRTVCDPPDRPRAALTGITTALECARHPWVFVIGCDVPFPNPDLITGLCHIAGAEEGPCVVVPRTGEVLHPLHAVYHRDLAVDARACLDRNAFRVQAFARHHARFVDRAALEQLNPGLAGLDNVNTPEDLNQARETERRTRPS